MYGCLRFAAPDRVGSCVTVEVATIRSQFLRLLRFSVLGNLFFALFAVIVCNL